MAKLRSVILLPFEAEALHSGGLGAFLRPVPTQEDVKNSNSMKIGFLTLKPGDHLAVREDFAIRDDLDGVAWLETQGGDRAVVRYDFSTEDCYCEPAEGRQPNYHPEEGINIQPGKEMPTWATQRWLEVVSVDDKPLNGLTQLEWASAGMACMPITAESLLTVHKASVYPFLGMVPVRPRTDKTLDEQAYANWQNPGADPLVRVIQVKALPPDTYEWDKERRRWVLQE